MWSLLSDARASLSPRPAGSVRQVAPVHQQLRAWPFWCDSLGHVNNASYLTIAALGRVRWLMRYGLLGPAIARRHAFLVAGVSVLYRREIPLMARFGLTTELVAFDARFLCFRSVFTLPHAGGERAATHVLARLALRGPHGPIDLRALATERGIALAVQAQPPADLSAWEQSQAAALRFIDEASADAEHPPSR